MLKKSLKLITVVVFSLGLVACSNHAAQNGKDNPIPNSISFTMTKFNKLQIKTTKQAGEKLANVEEIFGKPAKTSNKKVDDVKITTAEWHLNTSKNVDQPDTMTMSFSGDQLTAVSVKFYSDTNSFVLDNLQKLSDSTSKIVTRKMVDQRYQMPVAISAFSSKADVYVTYSYLITGKENKAYNFMFQSDNLIDEYQSKFKLE